jgi:Short C-terminal domain
VRRNPTPRSQRPDLLVRPPGRNDGTENAWWATMLDPVAPLVELADLRARGLISSREFERQKAKVIRGHRGHDRGGHYRGGTSVARRAMSAASARDPTPSLR